jgi:hypothetical protein
MLYTIAVVLLLGWLLGFVGLYSIGSVVHVLLVFALVVFLLGRASAPTLVHNDTDNGSRVPYA